MNSTSIDIQVSSPKYLTITEPVNCTILPMSAARYSKLNWNTGVSMPIKSNLAVGWPTPLIGKWSPIVCDSTSDSFLFVEIHKMCSSVSIDSISMLSRSPKKKSRANSAGIMIRLSAIKTWVSKNIWKHCHGSNVSNPESGSSLKNLIPVVLPK